MPVYRVKLSDGRTVTLEAATPPTEAQVLAALGPSEPTAKAEPPPPQMEAPTSALDRLAEWLPSVGGAIGGFVGKAPGARMLTAGIGGAAGEGYKQMLQHGAEVPGALMDVLHNLVSQPGATLGGFMEGAAEGATRAGAQGAIQAAAQGGGEAIGAGMSKAAPWLMQKALKPAPSLVQEYRTAPDKLAKTLLDEGINVTDAGLAKLQRLFGETNEQIAAAVAGSDATVSKAAVGSYTPAVAAKLTRQVNPIEDLDSVRKATSEFINHPIYEGPTLSVQEAQALKKGTYQQIGKKYGQVSAAGIETQKALARGLKDQIAEKVPGIAKLNARDSELMAAQDAVGRRVALSGNRDPVGFAWVTQNPTTFIAALIDRNPAIKSMLARGLYNSAGAAAQVSPQLIRAAVATIASGEDEGGETFARPANQ